MNAPAPFQPVEMMVTVKAYPAMSQKYGETVCVAGIRTDRLRPEWVRLFPVNFRDRPFMEQFRKYDVIRVLAGRLSQADTRPETLRPNLEAPIEVIGHRAAGPAWRDRVALVEPLMVGSMCEVARRQVEDRTSLAVFRPGLVEDLTFTVDRGDLSGGQKMARDQISLFAPGRGSSAAESIEKVPLTIRYRYRCLEPGCKGHHQSIIDWELGQAWRSWRDHYGEAGLEERIRDKWLNEILAPGRDPAFFVGNAHLRPKTFMILGVFWPPARDRQLVLA